MLDYSDRKRKANASLLSSNYKSVTAYDNEFEDILETSGVMEADDKEPSSWRELQSLLERDRATAPPEEHEVKSMWVTVRRSDYNMALLDLIPGMLYQAARKIQHEMADTGAITLLSESHQALTLVRSYMEFEAIKAAFENRALPNLITAQQVILNMRQDQIINTLRNWMALGSEGCRLVIGIPPSRRHVACEWVGRPGGQVMDARPAEKVCCRLFDDDVWEECREYNSHLGPS